MSKNDVVGREIDELLSMDSIEEQANPEWRLEWAREDLRLVENTIHRFADRYRVAAQVAVALDLKETAEMKGLKEQVRELIAKRSAWQELISELENAVETEEMV